MSVAAERLQFGNILYMQALNYVMQWLVSNCKVQLCYMLLLCINIYTKVYMGHH